MCSFASLLLLLFSNSVLYSAWCLTGRGGGDAERVFWPFLGSWWPSWSIRSMTLPGLLFFQVSDRPAFFIARLDQQLLTDSLSVMHPFWVSLWRPPMCFANEMEWIQENGWGVEAKGCGRAELGAFQVPSWSGSLSCTMRQYFSLRKCHSTFIWGGLGKRATTEYKVRGKCSKKSWMWDLHTSQNTPENSARALSVHQGWFNLMLTAISLSKQCRVSY